MKYFFIILITSSLTLFACNKTETDVEATLEWHGAYEVDGCGFFILLADSTLYKPVDESIIPDTFKYQYATPVIIDFKLPSKKIDYVCGLLAQNQDGIELISIKKK